MNVNEGRIFMPWERIHISTTLLTCWRQVRGRLKAAGVAWQMTPIPPAATGIPSDPGVRFLRMTNHRHHHDHHHSASANLRTAFLLNLTFTVIEIIGGLLTNSIAILSDALHDLGDSLALGTAWLLQNLSTRKSDPRFTFGYRRFSLLGSLLNCLIVIIGGLVVLAEAIPRLLQPESPHAGGMLGLAVLGIAVNGMAVLRLRGGKSLNERVVSWHLLEDVLGWFAVLIVSVVLLFKDIPILDPILSILITSWVMVNVIGNLKKTFYIFLQAVPDELSIESIEARIRELKHVTSVHHTHVWSLDGEHNVLSAHLVVDESTDRSGLTAIKHQVNAIGKELGIEHITVEIEFGDDDCSLRPIN